MQFETGSATIKPESRPACGLGSCKGSAIDPAVTCSGANPCTMRFLAALSHGEAGVARAERKLARDGQAPAPAGTRRRVPPVSLSTD